MSSKHNSVLAKHNANLPKHNTIFAKHNSNCSRLHNAGYHYTKHKPIITRPYPPGPSVGSATAAADMPCKECFVQAVELMVLGKMLSHSQPFMPLSLLGPKNKKRRERKLYERGNENSFYLDTSPIMERQKLHPSSICFFQKLKLTLFQFTRLLSSL